MSAVPGDARRMIRPALGVLDEWRQLAHGCRANLLIVGALAAGERKEIIQTIQVRCGLDGFHAQGPHGLLLPARTDLARSAAGLPDALAIDVTVSSSWSPKPRDAG